MILFRQLVRWLIVPTTNLTPSLALADNHQPIPINQSDKELDDMAILQMNRNARAPKKANHGARPCSSVMRRLKKRNYYRRWKQKMPVQDGGQQFGGVIENQPDQKQQDAK